MSSPQLRHCPVYPYPVRSYSVSFLAVSAMFVLQQRGHVGFTLTWQAHGHRHAFSGGVVAWRRMQQRPDSNGRATVYLYLAHGLTSNDGRPSRAAT